MGQQQLLLLVLGIVIVGLAVVVGIQAFGENQKKANADALVNDAIRIASDAQAFNLKPEAFGGGGGDFDGIKLGALGYKVDTGVYTNLNGTFAFTAIAAGSVTITGCSVQSYSDTWNQVTVTLAGTDPEDITTVVSNEEADCTPTTAEA